jgi:hypothetical protein
MSISTPAPRYAVAAHAAALPAQYRDRFAYYAMSSEYSRVARSVRNALDARL